MTGCCKGHLQGRKIVHVVLMHCAMTVHCELPDALAVHYALPDALAVHCALRVHCALQMHFASTVHYALSMHYALQVHGVCAWGHCQAGVCTRVHQH